MAVDSPAPRTYGGWRKPRSAGLGQLNGVTTVMIFTGAPIVIVANFIGGLWVALLVALVIVGAIYLMSREDKHGRSIMARIANRQAWHARVRNKTNIYRAGPLGQIPYGRSPLPGIGAQLELTEWKDSWGRPFGLLYMPGKQHFTAVFTGEPDGGSLVDEHQVDMWVAHWGHWLATMGNEPGIVGASVTIETAPDDGTRLRTEIEANLDPDAPALARSVLQEVAETYPHGSATVRAYIAITWSAQTRDGGHKRSVDEVAHDLATRLAFIGQQLSASGAGAIRPVSASEICELVRMAYDPASAPEIARSRAIGQPVPLEWADAGPVGADTHWDYYRHDSGVSRTWQMSQAPRGEVFQNVLQRLLEPVPVITRKRVTLAYRPIDPGTAAALVEQDRKAANIRMTSTHQPSLRVLGEKAAADATAREEARGAGLVNFSMYVTATVMDPADLPDATAAVENLAAGSRLFIRPVTGAQDSAFAAALPIGLVLPEYLALPKALLKGA